MPPPPHTLLTLLGKGREDPKTGYRKARYRFPDGTIRDTAFFGRALADYLAPDRLVVLGTAGSMWGVFVENLQGVEGAEEETRLELLEAEARGAVTQDLLDRLAPLMCRALGRDVVPQLVPYGQDAGEHYDVLHNIARHIHRGRVSFDLTHGFRHLGMVGFLSAFMLERLHNQAGNAVIEIAGLWYGALDMTKDGVAPVLRLDGLVGVQRWIDALDRFDASGNYAVFAELLEADGLPRDKAKCLSKAGQLLSLNNVADAARQVQPVLTALDALQSGPSALYRDKLEGRLRWAREPDLAEQQRLLALQALRRGDCLRATVLGWESFLTRLCQEQGRNPLNFEDRKAADEAFQAAIQADTVPDWKGDAYRLLKNLRNAMAHGTPPNIPSHRQLVQNPERLANELDATLNRLTNT